MAQSKAEMAEAQQQIQRLTNLLAEKDAHTSSLTQSCEVYIYPLIIILVCLYYIMMIGIKTAAERV